MGVAETERACRRRDLLRVWGLKLPHQYYRHECSDCLWSQERRGR